MSLEFDNLANFSNNNSIMRQCEICKKGSIMAGTRILLRGHYNPTNWTRKHPNLQKTKRPDGTRVLACTACIRTMAKKVE